MTIIEVVKEPTASIGMIEVALAAFGLTGVIMIGAVLAGLLAGAAIIWFRRRRPVSTIEARDHQHNLFRA
jgi:fructose-specific phosphotransferase system IIC component